jgi:hypothetical protein
MYGCLFRFLLASVLGCFFASLLGCLFGGLPASLLGCVFAKLLSCLSCGLLANLLGCTSCDFPHKTFNSTRPRRYRLTSFGQAFEQLLCPPSEQGAGNDGNHIRDTGDHAIPRAEGIPVGVAPGCRLPDVL